MKIKTTTVNPHAGINGLQYLLYVRVHVLMYVSFGSFFIFIFLFVTLSSHKHNEKQEKKEMKRNQISKCEYQQRYIKNKKKKKPDTNNKRAKEQHVYKTITRTTRIVQYEAHFNI